MRRFAAIASIAVAAQLLCGCFWFTTKSEGQALRKDVNSLSTRVDSKEKDLSGEVDQLKSVLDQATKVLKRNSADIGADVQGMQDDLRNLHGLLTAAKEYSDQIAGKVQKINARMDELDQRITALEKGATPGQPVPTANPDDLWNQGRAAFEAKKYDQAREAFKKLVVSFPNNARADDAQYFRAESYYNEKKYDDAIREYQKVFKDYPTSPLADDALFRSGQSASALKNCTEARAYYQLIKQKYPTSNLVKKAMSNDKYLKRYAHHRSKCKS